MARRSLAEVLRAHTVHLWAAAIALFAVAARTVRWWHPYCDAPRDGPGYFAWGLPLPYGQTSGASSGAFVYVPHVLALDLVLVAVAAFVVLRTIVRRAPASWRENRGSAATALVAVGMLTLFVTWTFATFGHAVPSLGRPYDTYWSYRPSGLAEAQGRTMCDS